MDRVLGSGLCRLLSLFHVRRGYCATPSQVKKVLIILLSEMGSLVLAYPMFRRIRALYPNAAVHILLFQKNREVLDLLKVVEPEQVLTVDSTSLMQLLRDSASVLSRLRRARFDVALDCELFSRISSIFSFLSGAPIRVGFHPHHQEGLYRGSFINRAVLYNPYQHISQQFVTLVEAIDSTTVPKAKRLVTPEPLETPSVHFGPEEIRAMRQRLHAYAPELAGKQLVLIHPGGGLLPIRAWPVEHYCRLSGQLLKEGYGVGVIGMGPDKGLAGKIQSYCRSPFCVDLTGYTKSVRELLLLFHCASLLVTNDGGPAQFSALTPIPTIVFFGPETPTLYGRFDPDAVIFYMPLSCSPCITAYNHRKSPCDANNVCLKQIDPDRVFAKAMELLARSDQQALRKLAREQANEPAAQAAQVPAPAMQPGVGEAINLLAQSSTAHAGTPSSSGAGFAHAVTRTP
jgi:ADP-heptose:LPS heptosyltransferase